MSSSKTDGLSPVQNFYKDKTIFLTGGTGFMGKVLIEKLLYTCPDVKEILVLMRPKRGMLPETRLEAICQLPMFQRIRDRNPEVLKKIVPVYGDVTYDKLGLTDSLIERVTRDTSIMFHFAATLKLEANLKDAIQMNTTGTKRAMELCKRMKQLQCFVHLSTAFCYCDKDVLHEEVLDGAHKPEEIMRIVEWMDAKNLEQITPNLLNPHPNTYTYSKRLAEMLVRDEYPNLPVVIVRPSIVCPAYKEPVEGWVDNLNGPIGIMVGGGKGVIRSMLCDGSLLAEVVPVDVAINGLLLVPFKQSQLTERPKQIPVYNATCTEVTRVTWSQVLDTGKKVFHQYPFEAGVWYPDGNITTNKFAHFLNVIFFHWIPAYFIDFIMLCIGQKRFMVRVQQKVSDGLDVLQFFTTRAWNFKCKNFMGLVDDLEPEDKKAFYVALYELQPKEYLFKCVLGGRQYCLKEPLSTIPKARMQLKMLYVLDRVTKLILLGVFVWLFLKFTGLQEILSDMISPSTRSRLQTHI